MDLLDLIVIAVAVAAAVGGYRLGFLNRALSWLGLGLGVYLGIRLIPVVIVDLATASPGVQVAVAILVLLGAAMVGQGLGMLIGGRLHRALPMGPARVVDRTVGACLGAVGVIVALWLLLPSLATYPGWPARAVSQSAISRWVSRDMPVAPNSLQVLRRLIGDYAPQVFSDLRPGMASGPPPAVNPLDQAVTDRVSAATVKVEGEACGLIYEGSGFTVAPDLVVTNAHVVAGEGAGGTFVLTYRGVRLPAKVIMFDPRIDLALLSVPSLGEPSLPLATAHAGALGAVFGHPEGIDELRVMPASVSQEVNAVGMDLYDQHSVRRDVLVLSATLAHGDSGGPFVNPSGHVIGVAFAISANNSDTAYALSSTELQTALGEARNSTGASTGGCLTS